MKTFALLPFIVMGHLAFSQTRKVPAAGESIPAFKLTNVDHYTSRTFDPMVVNGKWIVMDFWNEHCVSCVKFFPKVNKLQEEYKDHIQFLLVAQNDKKFNKNIAATYERYRKVMNLNLAIAYDSTLFSLFDVKAVPFIVIINPEKKIYAITDASALNHESLQELFDHGFTESSKTSLNAEVEPKQVWRFYLTDDQINKRDFLYESMIARYNGERYQGMGYSEYEFDQSASRGYHQTIGISLSQLYNLAYFGSSVWGRGPKVGQGLYYTSWKTPLLELSDSAAFEYDHSKSMGLYNYSIGIPKDKSNKAYLAASIQKDLSEYFGYDAAIEKRLMPCWILKATDAARKNLISRGQTVAGEYGPSGIHGGKRVLIDSMLSLIEQYSDSSFPFFDETGMKDQIDISFTAALTDVRDVQEALSKYGLILKKEKREFNVLVIRDKKL